ncbi:MAG: hypothetical protein A2087_10335 [Spirochaetes bacterium GWD1_61_31]|nr:MAG: hypothetical protein A2Y37_12180 [Spirochaetes bacterium GWB1_60_80]OHD30132.1 MAG: hypothetical protein A2004_14040 [Spirochaetes bacterium GWC1_61_12]OHD34614.1 MAG: hypothetical protein A2087_10335 [Spirochaetes bacterium GWD1_61_31]OHD46430.1 MAG: hypothetical protein A2Y35_10240 [Spirochaetes bacterium GWE1_60_18]OHD59486.1 MAG: hypothetical protein A2Y32_10195 [Spirochaetes bacterium GWF1_60_12]HAW86104.1 hypothetical protein [Spirochaetaceae bacterium]
MNIKDKLAKAYNLSAPAQKPEVAKPATTDRAAASPGKALGPAANGKAFKKTVAKDQAAWQASASFFKSGLPGIEKAAKFLLLLGQEEAASVLRHLKPTEVENISREIAKITQIDTAEANDILTEFGWLAKSNAQHLQGGPETAQRMLAAAFGDQKAKELLLKAVPDSWHPFDFLQDFEARQLVALLKDESSQVMAIILPHLEPKLASTILSELSLAVRTEVVKRIARLERMDNDVLIRVEAVLRDKIARQGRPDSATKLDGASILAGILRHADSDLEGTILSDLEDEHPDISKNIKDQLFTENDILRVGNKDIQKGLRDWHERDVAMLLKGKSQEFKDKLLNNISSSKRTIVLEEYDLLGSVRREDVSKATRNFVQFFKQRWEDGNLILEGEEDLVD